MVDHVISPTMPYQRQSGRDSVRLDVLALANS